MHDVNPVRRTPWVTYVLIAVNVAVFLFTPAARDTGVTPVRLAQLCQEEAFYDHYAAIPREMLDNRQLPATPDGEVGVGPNGPGCVVRPSGYHKIPVLSVLYSMFLHGGWLHLLGNMLFLWVFGNNVEDRLGRLRYLVFYLLCGYLAAYGFALVNANATDPLIGASGAIAGVLGAYLMFFPRARVWSLVPFLLFIPLRLPAWLVLGLWFVLQWAYSAGYAVSAAGSVAYVAHVVGFVFGFLAAVPFLRRRPPYPYQGYPRRPWS